MAQTVTVTLRVTPERLKIKSDEISREISEMTKAFVELTNRFSRTSYYWKGAGGDDCRALYNRDKKMLEELFRRLKEHPRDLLAMAQIYENVEDRAERMPDVLRSNLIQ